MIRWLFGAGTFLPTFDHGDLTYKEIWYMMGDPEPVLINRKTNGFSEPRPDDRYEIHFSLAEHRSPKYEDRSYDVKYKLKKHGKTQFTQPEAAELIKWMIQRHHMAHDD